MLSYSDALNCIKENISHLPSEEIAINSTLNRIASSDIFCKMAVPSFANSAMDGFAISSNDTLGANHDAPVILSVTNSLTAGTSAKDIAIKPGNAVEITTGSTLPQGCDAVVPMERVEILDNKDNPNKKICIKEEIKNGANLRKIGEDFQIGDQLLNQGQLITANQIMALAATGIESIEVTTQPKIGVITTGNELNKSGANEKKLNGVINDANGPYLQAAIESLKLQNMELYRCKDSPDDFKDLIQHLSSKTNIILTTGGVSAGKLDFIPSALKSANAEILFHKASIRPGKPLLFARMPNGQLIFGLPGNPIAVAVGFRFFVIPALLKLQGHADEKFSLAKLTNPLRKKLGLTFFAKALATRDQEGRLNVTALPGQESFKINPLIKANCWIIAKAESDNIAEGSDVEIAPIFPWQKF
ncbi:MAG: gephyrin-like molybdotransferase Glp [Pseudomonadota bacterium]|nr:gephyrin-like molybdotransferase Glp [Pseudomonadota bacterium]